MIKILKFQNKPNRIKNYRKNINKLKRRIIDLLKLLKKDLIC